MAEETQGKGKRDLLTLLLCNLFLSLTVAFFAPMEVLLINLKEFYFSFGHVWWVQLLLGTGAGLVLTAVMFLLPPRAGRIAAAVSLGLGIAAYVQVFLLNGQMSVLSGEDTAVSSGDRILNLAIWCLILLAVVLTVILAGRRKERGTRLFMRFAAAALTVMQAVGFVSIAATTDLSGKQVGHYLTTDGAFEVGRGKNVAVFVLDTADGAYAREMMEAFPELNESLSGWTWYPNATSTYSRTFPAIINMLTGEKFFFDHDPYEYIEDAYAKNGFLKVLYETGTDIRVLLWNPDYLGSAADPYVANSSPFFFGKFENLDLGSIGTSLLKMGLYKCLPYQFKESCSYDITEINFSAYKGLEEGSEMYSYISGEYEPQPGGDAGAYCFKDDEFYYELSDGMKASDTYDQTFRFFHLQGVHPGYYWDENLDTTEEESPAEPYRALRGSFRIIEEYISKLKEMGLYDQSTIIVTADHGYSGPGGDGDKLERVITACPLLMVKLPGSDTSKPLAVSHAPVCHEDLFATVENALGAKISGTGSGKAVTDFREGEARDRYYYFIASWKYAGPEVCLREYVIDGDAEDIANWKLTGNWWDITHSVNVISKDPFP